MARSDELPEDPLAHGEAISSKVPVDLLRVLEARAHTFELVKGLLRILPRRDERHRLVMRTAEHEREVRALEGRWTLEAALVLRETARELLEDAEHLYRRVDDSTR